MELETYTSLRAAPELIGRGSILKDIHTAILKKGKTPQVFYITAWGGWGKTRLLNAIVDKLDAGKPGEWATPRILSSSRLVDLYHTNTHNHEGLIADIAEALDDAEQSRFKNYLEQRDKLDIVKYDLSAILRTVMLQRQDMMRAFLDDFNRAAKAYDKIVLAFDTVENLMYEEDRVQTALGLADEPIGVGGWLVRDFLPKIENSVVLIAGRPETEQLKNELKQLEENHQIELQQIELGAFSEEESLAYFEAVLEVAKGENTQVAERLAGIPKEIRQVVHYFAGGQPFMLSLFVDYLFIADVILPIIDIPLDEIKEKASIAGGLEKEQAEFRNAILSEFRKLQRPFDEVVRALAWAPKGMGAELLAWVLKRERPSDEEIEDARGYIDTLRDPKLQLSFVKIRKNDSLVFLQDEMYKLMRSLYEQGRMRYNVGQTYELIADFYEERKDVQAVKESKMQKAPLMSSGSSKEFTEVQRRKFSEEQGELRRERARLHSYQVEHVYYCLQAGYIRGIQAYYRAAEEAFQSNDQNLWLLLRDELLRFAKPLRGHGNEEPALNYIDADIGVRWIRTNIANGDYDRALQQIERFRESCPDLLIPDSFAELSLKIWESWALIYSGRDYNRAEKILQEVLAFLTRKERVLADPFDQKFDAWRLNLLTAYAQDIIGYLYRSEGNFARAVEYYQKNIRYWRELKVESEHANTLNNLSWSFAEIGDFESAIRYCSDGLELRRKLGHRYPIALSFNTLGLIETRNGQPANARLRCEQALVIFRDLEQPRGIGLACTALAEALRRMTNVADLLPEEQSIRNLELAEQYALEAVDVFQKRVHEPLRLTEAFIELGCIYRELARRHKKDGQRMNEFLNKGEDAFDHAAETAKAQYAYRGVDALVNKAWMYYYIDDFDRAEKQVEEVTSRIDREYFFTEHGIPSKDGGLVPWIWVQLGKAYLLLGRMAFDRFKEARELLDQQRADEHLHIAGQKWALSMAYNELYGKDFRDIIGGRTQIYKNLSPLNEHEMAQVRKGAHDEGSKYADSQSLRSFETFIIKNFILEGSG